MAPRTRSILAGLTTLALMGAIGATFWYQDLQYSLPTPKPPAWHPVAAGTRVALPPDIEALRRENPGKAIFLHFFNPSCPCSRFNLDHVRQLVAAFGKDVVFVAVLREETPETLERAYRALGLDIPYHVDPGALAEATGIYSTPQAAILDADGRLFYQGNYNLTRYCRNRETEFARLALERLRIGAPPSPFVPAATIAYGCPLPSRAKAPSRRSL
jgi:hypothetical protein